MEIRTALAQLRDELGMKQIELAEALGVNAVTVNRWETGKNPPSRAMSRAIIACAVSRGASKVCVERLKAVLFPTKGAPRIDNLKFAELDQINELVNESSNAVFVCDAATRRLLYVNRRLAAFAERPLEDATHATCYGYLLHRDAPCEFCRMAQMKQGEFVMQEYESAATGRHFMTRSKLTRWCGRKACIGYITDVTELNRARGELAESHGLISAACRDAEMWVFVLNLRDGSARLEPYAQEKLNLPETAPDFLTWALTNGAVRVEYEQRLREAVARLRQGAASAELVIRSNFQAPKTHWVRLRARVEGQNADTALCSAQVIDNEIAMEARIRFEHERIVEGRGDLMSYSIANVSRNVIAEQRRVLDGAASVCEGEPFDRAVSAAAERIAPESDRERFEQLHNRAALLADFASGELAHTMDCQQRQADGRYRWVRMEMKLMLHPDDGDVYLYEYSFGVQAAKIADGMIAHALQNGYEVLGAASMLDGGLTTLRFEGKEQARTAQTYAYAEAVRAYAQKHVAPEERADFLQKTSLEQVRRQLDGADVYRVPFGGAGPNERRLAEFAWYDTYQNFCLISVMKTN